jgi:hypothetical protein
MAGLGGFHTALEHWTSIAAGVWLAVVELVTPVCHDHVAVSQRCCVHQGRV